MASRKPCCTLFVFQEGWRGGGIFYYSQILLLGKVEEVTGAFVDIRGFPLRSLDRACCYLEGLSLLPIPCMVPQKHTFQVIIAKVKCR